MISNEIECPKNENETMRAEVSRKSFELERIFMNSNATLMKLGGKTLYYNLKYRIN